MFHVKHLLTNMEKKGRFKMKKIILSVSLALLIIVSTCICAFADTVDFPEPTLDPPYTDSYIIYLREDFSYNYYVCVLYNSDDWTVEVDKNTNYLVWTKNRDTAYIKYSKSIKTTEWSGSWGTFSQDNSVGSITFGNSKTIYKSNKDIYDTENKLFFQGLPLEKVIMKTLTEKMIPMMVGTLKILVPCGVGCLALLIVLGIFGKKSLIFRA